MPNQSSSTTSKTMHFDMATLFKFGITFYNNDCKENVNPKGITAASVSESELQNSLRKKCINNKGINSSNYDQFGAVAVSPRLSDILHEFSVPQGIVPIKDIQKSVVPCVHCTTGETPTKKTEHVTDTLQDIPEESIAIDVSDNESMPVEPAPENPKRRGRKPLPKEKVIPGEWYCKPCDKNFMSKGGLSQHTIARHTTNRTHQCNICNKRFEYLQDMEEHRARHSADNKPHECSFEGCNRRFMYRFDLNRHFMRNHGNVTNHCSICAKGFARKDHLAKHLISHKNKTVIKVSIKQM